ncbi:hypothetical protein psal_cds_727 [Pandoravirus salinus]|uniref:F-box domain containing protein n=1 Tax=Pandoravirus salinus TaxID=1349410 RepID=S4VYZ0_9VIRU|nr:hypothetical protein psal_cds_727 [Pandoravirus salinus]AGO84706.1 hypothetical protein psal_cds_727 [Pandoravirus salinus]
MKRTQNCNTGNLGDEKSDLQGNTPTYGSRPAKVVRIDVTDWTDVAANARRRQDDTTIDVLPDDILYHLFQGMCAADTPIFPPECRWVPALVCRRWRAVVASITRADAQAAPSRLRDVIWDAPPPERVHKHTFVRASGMALMVRHGLPTDAMGAWTTAEPDLMDVAAALMASAVPERVREAYALVAKDDTGSKRWAQYIDDMRPAGSCWQGATSRCQQHRHVLVAVAAGFWEDADALLGLAKAYDDCCIEVATWHAARHERIDVVRALLAILLAQSRDGMATAVGNVFEPMWLLVGRHSLFALARLLLDIEDGRDPALCDSDNARQKLANVRLGGRDHDGNNWLMEAAEWNRVDCFDFAVERDHWFHPKGLAAAALFSGSVEFYEKVVAWDCVWPWDGFDAIVPSFLLTDALVGGADWGMNTRARALAYIIEHPEFDPFVKVKDHYLIDVVFDVWDAERGSVAILQAAAVVTHRWPHVWARYWVLPSRGPRCHPPPAIQVWREAADRVEATTLAQLPTDTRADIQAFLRLQDREWRNYKRGSLPDVTSMPFLGSAQTESK